jgi:hypothetical protein
LEHSILSQFSFSKPEVATAASSSPTTTPKVTSFSVSDPIADYTTNRGQINFSWTTQNADYVRLSYNCTGGEEIIQNGLPSLGLDGVIILETGAAGTGCGGKLDVPQLINHSPNSSLDVGFANSSYDAPVEVRVTITPFSHGVAYAKSAKTIPISVYPDGQFRNGPPTPTGNITVLSPPNTKRVSNYRQGSSSKIEWTDSREGDDHFWLSLVQDNTGNGIAYLYQIAGYVPRTGSSTNYTWVVPKSYSGSGFRISITSGDRAGISNPFNIVP